MEYSDKYILFIDILGFKQYVDETFQNGDTNIVKTQSFYNLMKSLRIDLALDYEKQGFEWQSYKKNTFFKDAVITQFSDSIIISYDIKNGTFERLLQDANHIFITGIYFDFIFRGAITKGKIIHDSDIVFGPGFIKAYQLEDAKAKYPRIIIDEEVVNNIKEPRDEVTKKLVKKDLVDNQFYIDIFSGLYERYKNERSVEISLKHIRQIYENGIKNEDSHICEKYTWIKEKYMEYIDNVKGGKHGTN